MRGELKMSKDVYVIAEQRDGKVQKVSVELIGEATKLAKDLGEQVVAVLVGSNVSDKAESLIQYGADKVIVVDDPELKDYRTEPGRNLRFLLRRCVSSFVLKVFL